ncbi:DUF6695 family protein [Polaribacter porphyrae]|uniref:Uncharacterized protein n=1 Tax=Polaribacter porphyrae TaxID=1137780 RepID=A0A2S7WK79_9FLAO|nr:DUF6695 family protein [Polaribacter porphyrae]PQJ78010.1 hypothetical protein BTO18_01870 [Polaribacter porphyrae]
MSSKQNKKNDGIIVILSYPDTVVRPAYREFSSKIWPKIGIGSKHAVQAGHAALLLIKKNAPKINYFDFGRYITTHGNGRVRSAETDPELLIPLTAKFENNKLTNLKEILLWIENHPEKTHGSGRLIAGINEQIDYNKALKFINNLIDKKELPYGAFIKKGTNCARFVTDTIIASTSNNKIKLHLKNSNLFTPSPIGNVIKATTSKVIYKIDSQEITSYKNRSILKEYKASFFNKFDTEPNLIGTELADTDKFELENGTWLGGIGSGAWFSVEKQISNQKFLIARYDVLGNKEYEREFIVDNTSFNINENFEFMHPSNFTEMHIIQNKEKYIFKRFQG